MSQSLSFTFGRHERLKSDVQISQLYTQGKSISKYPLRITYLVHSPLYYTDASVKVSINASKKGLRLAVKRNRMKRLLREMYRHHKHPLQSMLNRENCCLSMGIVYVGTHLSEFEPLERLYLKLQKRIIDAVVKELASGSVRMNSGEKQDVSSLDEVAIDVKKDITGSMDGGPVNRKDIIDSKDIVSDSKEDITGSKHGGLGVKEDL